MLSKVKIFTVCLHTTVRILPKRGPSWQDTQRKMKLFTVCLCTNVHVPWKKGPSSWLYIYTQIGRTIHFSIHVQLLKEGGETTEILPDEIMFYMIQSYISLGISTNTFQPVWALMLGSGFDFTHFFSWKTTMPCTMLTVTNDTSIATTRSNIAIVIRSWCTVASSWQS